MPRDAKPNPASISPATMIAEIERSARVVDSPKGGCRIRWRIWGQGPRLILLHGNGGSWLHWAKNVLSLSRDYMVMVPDIPGFGDSTSPPPPHNCHSLGTLLHASASPLTGSDPVAVVGFSMGSSIGAKLAKAYGAKLEALVLVAAGGGFGVSSIPVAGLRSWRSLDDPAARRKAHRHNVKLLMLGPEAPDLDLAEEIQARGNEAVHARFCRERDGAGLHATLSAMAVPMHAIWGEEDMIMRGYRAEREAYFGSVGAGLTFLPGAGHWVQFERPEAVEDVIRNACFTEEIAGGFISNPDPRKD